MHSERHEAVMVPQFGRISEVVLHIRNVWTKPDQPLTPQMSRAVQQLDCAFGCAVRMGPSFAAGRAREGGPRARPTTSMAAFEDGRAGFLGTRPTFGRPAGI